MCKHTKDLYNYANYLIRQEFLQNKQYIQYKEINFDLKSNELYKLCMSQPANCVLRRLDKNWKSFFKAIKDWKEHKEKYNAMPKLNIYSRQIQVLYCHIQVLTIQILEFSQLQDAY